VPTRRMPTEEEQENEVTTTADLLGTREIEVDAITPVAEAPGDDGFVVIRMSETIEEFTYGNPHVKFHLERGNRYRVPRHIAGYLDSLGYVWH
jgi:hypothetical protein